MSELECHDTEQLEAELERRKQEKEEKDKPRPVSSPDWFTVQRYCEGYIEALYIQGHDDTDAEHDIFEAAMEAAYGGREVWKWINERLR